jgi:hypothetical protein
VTEKPNSFLRIAMSPVSLLRDLRRTTFIFPTAIVSLYLALLYVLTGTAGATPSQQVYVYITPKTASVSSKLTQQFTGKVTGSDNQSVTWSATQGSISSTGLFTAPTVTVDTTVDVTVTSVADPTKSATAVVTVSPPVSVSISPTTVTMNSSKQQPFVATVSNTQQTRVTWSVTQGTISGGMFTSPKVTSTTTVRITATSVEDPTKSATAVATVMPPISVTVTPSSATVTASDTLQLTGVVQNATDPAVTWSTTQGTVSSKGLFTAPYVLVPTWVNVTATSVEDPNRQARAQLTVEPPASPALTIVTPLLPGTSVSSSYSFALGATGGFTPYQWTLSSGSLPAGITLNSNGVLSGSATEIGEFSISLKVSDAGTHHAQQKMNLFVSGSAKGQVIPMSFFGMHIDWPNTPWPSIAFGGQRFWDSDTGWSQINTAQGVFDWTTLDTRINTALANKVDVLFDLARTPVWAQCASDNPACGSGNATFQCGYNLNGQGGLGQCFPPADLNVDGSGTNQHFIDWVTALASRYKGRIKYYEIWNEPTVPTMWQGTNAQLVRMAQDAHCIVVGTGCNSKSTYTLKAIDPAAQITTPAFVSDSGTTFTTAMSDFINAGGGSVVDVIAYHGYVNWPAPPENAVTDAAPLQSMLVTTNQQLKPLFSTEGGFGPRNTITDQDQEAAWIARYLILQQSIGLARSYWYAWDASNTPFWTEQSGNQSGATTFSEVSAWLVGATLSSPCVGTGTVWQCGYTRPGGYKALAVWDTSQTCNAGVCTTSNFTIPAGYTYVLDLTGVKTKTNGSTLKIGIKPLLLENQ